MSAGFIGSKGKNFADKLPGQRKATDEKLTVKELLARLDPEIRVVLQLHYLDGLTLSEIASILNVPTGTIKSRLYYARKLLAKESS